MSYPGNYELLEGRGGIILTYYQTEACRVGGSVREWGEGKGGREKGDWVAGRTDGWRRGSKSHALEQGLQSQTELTCWCYHLAAVFLGDLFNLSMP